MLAQVPFQQKAETEEKWNLKRCLEFSPNKILSILNRSEIILVEDG
jgi:hypothetical protein